MSCTTTEAERETLTLDERAERYLEALDGAVAEATEAITGRLPEPRDPLSREDALEKTLAMLPRHDENVAAGVYEVDDVDEEIDYYRYEDDMCELAQQFSREDIDRLRQTGELVAMPTRAQFDRIVLAYMRRLNETDDGELEVDGDVEEVIREECPTLFRLVKLAAPVATVPMTVLSIPRARVRSRRHRTAVRGSPADDSSSGSSDPPLVPAPTGGRRRMSCPTPVGPFVVVPQRKEP